MDHLDQLNSTREMEAIASKLPNDIRRSWRDKYYDLVESGTVVKFVHLEEFVKGKAGILNLVCFGNISEPQKKSFEPANQRKSFQLIVANNDPVSLKKIENTKYCLFCKQAHFLIDCMKFMLSSYNDKVEFIKSRKLCFGCLNGGHSKFICNRKKKCSICNCDHPTCLHREQKVEKEDSSPSNSEEISANLDNNSENGASTQTSSHSSSAHAINTAKSFDQKKL